MNSRLKLLTLGVAAAGLAPWASASPPPASQPGFQPVEAAFHDDLQDVPDVPGLPRVLLIGDSISIGYTQPVRARLRGQANLHRPGENGGSSTYGLSRIDEWLGTGRWDVIHFNFGLHDLKYLDAKGTYTTPDLGRQVNSVEQYRANLQVIVKRLQATGAKVIFATSTPVPAGATGRVAGSEAAYNAAALEVMRAAGVAVDDLHAFAAPRLATLQQPHNVHFTPEGSQQLADVVAASIRAALPPPTVPLQ